MFMEFDRSLVRQHNEELIHGARKWHLQRRLRANREQSIGTPTQVDSRSAAIEVKQQRAPHIKLQLRKVRPVWSMKSLALSLLGQRRSSYGHTPR